MEEKTRVFKNFAFQTANEILTIIIPLITTPYLSRTLGPVELGRYSFVHTVAYYFVVFGGVGMEVYGTRQIAAVKNNPDKLNETFSLLYSILICFSIISFLAYVILIALGALDRGDNSFLGWIMGFYVLSNVFNVRWLFQGLELFNITVIRNTIIRILTIICIFTFIKEREDVENYAIIYAFLSCFVCELTLFVMAHRYVKFRKPDFQSVAGQLKPLFLLFMPYAANILLRHVDKLMLGTMSDMQQTGYYEDTDKIYTLLVVMVSSMGTVLMPRIMNMVANGKGRQAENLGSLATRVSIIFSVAIAFGVSAIADEFIPLFLGDEFLECIVLVKMIAPTIVFLSMSNMVRKTWILPKLKTNIYIWATGSALVTNIIFNAVLIRYCAARGAVLATIISEVVVVAVQFLFLHKELDYRLYFQDLLYSSIVGFIMLLAVRMSSHINTGIIIRLAIEIAVGAMVYIGLIFICFFVRKDPLIKELKTR